jgi:hypothetical protein
MAISLGGGGSASVINETIYINSTENLITLEDGRVYLKGGVTSTDITTYPDATAGLAYTGVTFSTASQASFESDIDWDGTYLYVLERGSTANGRVYRYNTSGVYQNVSWSVASQDNEMQGVVCVGSDFYLCGAQYDKVYKYNSAGVFQSDFSVSTNGRDPNAIAYDGTYLWVLSYYHSTVYKYSLAGVYQNVSFSVVAQDNNARGLAFDGTHFWMSGRQADKLFQYTAAGVFTGFSLSVAAQGTSPYGLTWDGSALWTLDDSSSAAFKYQKQIGVDSVSSGSAAAGFQNYVRIK